MNTRRLFFLILLILKVAIGQSQDCEETLNKATAEFDAGRFYGLPSLLKPCLDNGFSSEQKVRAYLLLTQAYLVLEDPIAAEDSYLKLLKADPEYLPSKEKDPIDVFYLSKKFTATPIFTPHFRVGINTSWTSVIYNVGTDPYPEVSKKSIFKPGYLIGGGMDWNVTDNWSLCGEANYSFKSFKKNTRNISGDDGLTVVEKQNWLDIPVYVKYSKSTGKIRPFAYGGFAINLLLSDRASLEGVDRSPSQGNVQSSIEPGDSKLTSKRNFMNRAILLGGGVKYKVGKDFVFVDVRCMPGLSNLVKPDENYLVDGQLDNATTKYRWVSDLYRINNVSFSFGYVRPLYDPRKIRYNFITRLFSRKKKNE